MIMIHKKKKSLSILAEKKNYLWEEIIVEEGAEELITDNSGTVMYLTKVYSIGPHNLLFSFYFQSSFRQNWQISCIRYTTWRFDICIHCEMIIAIKSL